MIWGAYDKECLGTGLTGFSSSSGNPSATLIIGAPGEALTGTDAGWIGAYSTPISEGTEKKDSEWQSYFSTEGQGAGAAFIDVGDIDGNSYGDLWVAGDLEKDSDEAHLFLGAGSGPGTQVEVSAGWPGFGYSAAGLEVGGSKRALALGNVGWLHNTGAVWIWTSLPKDGDPVYGAEIQLYRSDEGDQLSWLHGLESADFDGDGIDGLLISEPLTDSMYLLEQSTWAAADFRISDVAWRFEGAYEDTQFGNSPQTSDFNGGGYTDWAVSAPRQSTSTWSNIGFAYVFLSDASGWTSGGDAGDADASIQGKGGGSSFGLGMATGDTNRDDISDLAAFQALDQDNNTTWLFIGPLEGTLTHYDAAAEFGGIEDGDCGWLSKVRPCSAQFSTQSRRRKTKANPAKSRPKPANEPPATLLQPKKPPLSSPGSAKGFEGPPPGPPADGSVSSVPVSPVSKGPVSSTPVSSPVSPVSSGSSGV